MRVTKFCMNTLRAVKARGAVGAMASPDFGRSVNPISIRGVDYAHHIITCPPGFPDLLPALTVPLYILKMQLHKKCFLKKDESTLYYRKIRQKNVILQRTLGLILRLLWMPLR